MKVDKLNLERVFERTERLEAPLFQRPYVWRKKENWQPLWESIQAMAERRLEGRTLHPHFLGTIVLDQVNTGTGKIHVRQLIDGQQRLTTLQVAIAAARDMSDADGHAAHAKAFEKLTVNDVPLSDDPDDVFKVWPTNADRDAFKQVMLAKSVGPVRKIAKAGNGADCPIPDAYLFFHKTFAAWLAVAGAEKYGERLDALYRSLRDDLHLVVIDLEDSDDAQEIFETLNSLGAPLLPADLVKNFLFHQIDERSQSSAALYKRYWRKFDEKKAYWRAEVRQGRLKRPRLDLFLGHFLTLQRRDEVLISQLFSAYRDMVREQTPVDVAAHMERFSSYADVYASFESLPAGSREALFFKRLTDLDTSAIYPVILEVMKRYAGDEHAPERHAILTDVESYFVRRAVCGLSTKSYTRVISDMLKMLGSRDDFSAHAIREVLMASEADSARWPADEEFERGWRWPYFYLRLRKRARMALEAIELAMRTEKSEKITTIDETLTIEHLIPQKWQTHWNVPGETTPAMAERRERLLHSVGNLTLVTKALNPSMGNDPWKAKLDQINYHSLLMLNQNFTDSWDEERVETRTTALWQYAKAIWPRPAAS